MICTGPGGTFLLGATKNKTSILSVLIVLVFGSVSALADGVPCTIEGMLGVAPVTEQSCAAIWLPVPNGQAVTGVRWFNNDAETVFPQVLLASGDEDLVVDASAAVQVAQNVAGPEQSWAEVIFDQPYACDSAGLYCLFMLPVGSEYSAPGIGAAFGYTADPCGHQGWFGGDEDSWMRISGKLGLAIDPILVDAEDGVLVMKSMQSGRAIATAAPALLGVHPNPFNPQTVLEYRLPQAMSAELAIYDVRGQLVRRLVSGHQAAGAHSVTWIGTDDSGRRASSGVYLARFVAGSVVQTQRLVLVK